MRGVDAYEIRLTLHPSSLWVERRYDVGYVNRAFGPSVSEHTNEEGLGAVRKIRNESTPVIEDLQNRMALELGNKWV